MADFYLDFEGGNDANDGTTFANRWKTVINGATAARIAPGDRIKIMASITKTSVGQNATFTNKSDTVTLSSALNTLITDCESAWTASANVTCTAGTSRKLGSNASNNAIAAGFTTGKVSYFDLGSNQDYSAAQGITFWLSTNLALASGVLQIKLCSDATGDTPVDTLTIPQIGLGSNTTWQPIYIDKGSALGSAIRSIALYAVSDPGTVTIILDNISTVKAKGASQTDNLNLTSLIAATSTGLLYPIRSINGTSVKLDMGTSQLLGAAAGRGWSGTTGSYALYKQEPTKIDTTVALFGYELAPQESGAAGFPITFSGGWNRSDMSVQSGETYCDGGHGFSNGWGGLSARNYITFEKLHPVRFNQGYSFTSWSNLTVNGTVHMTGCNDLGLGMSSGTNCTFGDIEGAGNANGLIGVNACRKLTFGNCTSHGSGVTISKAAIYLNGTNYMLAFGNLDLRNGLFYGLSYETVLRLKIGNIVFRDWDNFAMGPPLTTSVCAGWVIGDIDASACTGGVVLPLINQNRIRFGTIQSVSSTFGVVGQVNASGFIKAVVTSSNSSGGWATNNTRLANVNGRVKTSNQTDSTKYPNSGFATSLYPPYNFVRIRNYENGADANTVIYGSLASNFATVTVETGSNRHTASGKGWKASILNAVYSQNFPFRHKIGTIYCEASALVTLRLWVNRSHANLIVSLVQPTIQIGGVTTDVVATMSVGASTWEELQITFTPSESGIIKPELRAYPNDGVTTYTCFFDDMTVIQ